MYLSDADNAFFEIFDAIENKQYSDIVLDFNNIKAIFADVMIPICAIVRKYQERDVLFDIRIDKSSRLWRNFINANWAYLINKNFAPSKYRGFSQHPATVFNDDTTLIETISSILDCILKTTTEITRGDLAVIEWSLAEIMENSLRHSASSLGGIIQVSKFNNMKKHIEIVIADSGVGIPYTLRENPEYAKKQDFELVQLCVNEGVTRGNGGMGNGLFGAFTTSIKSGGNFSIRSLHGYMSSYISKNGRVLNIKNKKIFKSTLNCIMLVSL